MPSYTTRALGMSCTPMPCASRYWRIPRRCSLARGWPGRSGLVGWGAGVEAARSPPSSASPPPPPPLLGAVAATASCMHSSIATSTRRRPARQPTTTRSGCQCLPVTSGSSVEYDRHGLCIWESARTRSNFCRFGSNQIGPTPLKSVNECLLISFLSSGLCVAPRTYAGDRGELLLAGRAVPHGFVTQRCTGPRSACVRRLARLPRIRHLCARDTVANGYCDGAAVPATARRQD